MPEKRGLRRYGISKEHRPTSIVQTGLFRDGGGIPPGFCINKPAFPRNCHDDTDQNLNEWMDSNKSGLPKALRKHIHSMTKPCYDSFLIRSSLEGYNKMMVLGV